jgi:pilus assembly protein CpaB
LHFSSFALAWQLPLHLRGDCLPHETGIYMNRRLMTVLLLAFVLAGGCSLIVYRIIGVRLAGARKSATTRVVSAAGDIKLGTILTASNLSYAEIAGQLPKGAILKPEVAIGRGVVTDLSQGEPILESRLAAAGSGGGLAATIRQGMRACAVKVDEVIGVAGFVTPGMRVDVLVSGNPPGNTSGDSSTQVRTLLQNIEVLSAGASIEKDAEGKPQQVRVVNLLVTPEDAQVLGLATGLSGGMSSHIQLVLRNPLDTEIAKVAQTGVAELFSNTGSPGKVERAAVATHSPKAYSAPAVYTIEVLNGSQRTEQKFASSEEK